MTPRSDQPKPGSSTPKRADRASDKGTAPPERISLFATAFFEGAGPVLTTTTNRPFQFAVLGVEELTAPDLLKRIPLPWVLADVPYARGLSGKHWLILGRTSAVLLGHVLLQDDEDKWDDALEFLPAYDEVIREMLNQMLSAAAATLTPLITRSIEFEPVSLQLIDDDAALPAELSAHTERLWLVRTEATGPEGIRAELALIIGGDLALEIVTLASEAPMWAVRGGPGSGSQSPVGIDLILDVALPVAVELGRARMQIQDVLKLAPGSIIELDKSAGDPVEILINDHTIAKGEVVVIDENFGVRVTSIVTATERIKTLR